MDDVLTFGQQVLAAQPFSQLLGAQLTAFQRGAAELVIPISADLLQQHGAVHGGVLSYAADNALTFAGGSVLGPNVVTGEYTINYLKPAQGTRLIARASVVAASGRQAVCRCEVWCVTDAGEELCAAAQGTIIQVGSAAVQS